HLLRQRGEMRRGKVAVAVLDQVQVLDQQVAPALAVAKQGAHLVERTRINLPALGGLAGAIAPSRARPLSRPLIVGSRIHVWNPSQLIKNGRHRSKTSPQLPSID